MATYNFTGFAPDAFSQPTGSTMQLEPDWDGQDDGYDFEITDDESDFQGDAGNDTMSGGDGTGYGDSIDASATTDGTEIETGGGDDTITGGQGDDRLLGEDDADTFIVEDNFGNDTIDGGEGGDDDDTIDLTNLSGLVTVTYSGGRGRDDHRRHIFQ